MTFNCTLILKFHTTENDGKNSLLSVWVDQLQLLETSYNHKLHEAWDQNYHINQVQSRCTLRYQGSEVTLFCKQTDDFSSLHLTR